jgi:hypothetical protein
MFTHCLLLHSYINDGNGLGICGLVDCSQPRFRERGLRGILFHSSRMTHSPPISHQITCLRGLAPRVLSSLPTSFTPLPIPHSATTTECQSPKLRTTSSHSLTRTCASPLLIRACFWGNSNALIRFVPLHIPLFSHLALSTPFNFRYSSIQFDCKG